MDFQLDPNSQRVVNEFWQKMVRPLDGMYMSLGNPFKFVHICDDGRFWSRLSHGCVVDEGSDYDRDYANAVYEQHFAPLRKELERFFKWCQGVFHEYKVTSIHISPGSVDPWERGIKVNLTHRKTGDLAVFIHSAVYVPVYA